MSTHTQKRIPLLLVFDYTYITQSHIQEFCQMSGNKKAHTARLAKGKTSVLQSQRTTTGISWQWYSPEVIRCLSWNANPAVQQAQGLHLMKYAESLLRRPKTLLFSGISASFLFWRHHLRRSGRTGGTSMPRWCISHTGVSAWLKSFKARLWWLVGTDMMTALPLQKNSAELISFLQAIS